VSTEIHVFVLKHGLKLGVHGESINFIIAMVYPGWMPGAHQSCSITPPPRLGRWEKGMMKGLVDWDKDGETSRTNYCHWQNRLDLGKAV